MVEFTEIEQILNSGRKSDSKGQSCHFFRSNNGKHGLKCFKTKLFRDSQYNMQVELYKLGLAPEVGNKFSLTVSVDGETIEHHGYVTECVLTVMQRQKDKGLVSDNYNPGEHFSGDYSELAGHAFRFNEYWPEFDVLKEKLVDDGYYTYDNHHGNLGWDKHGNAVLIDFDHA